ncbi:permease prefix domain 1-containing protein [Agromyces sp. NPDC056523]|uniref:permease prefix domain 1-containing protein n=1 Tax=Agromyces sp. NPDC056523 TaxID=3345850 RepID=UPI00366BD2CC
MGIDERRDLDGLVASWREWLERRDVLDPPDVDELESHLLDRIDELRALGLRDDEAFLVAVKRLGAVDELSREYARVHSERLWAQLVLGDADGGAEHGSAAAGADGAGAGLPFARRAHGLAVALGLGVGAGVAVKAADLLSTDPTFLLRNIAVLVLPFLAAWFAWRHRPPAGAIAVIAGAFVLAAVVLNAYPFGPGAGTEAFATEPSMTELLAAIHAPVALWLITGVAYASGAWRSSTARMDFVRFSGEWAVYYLLIALVGGALSMLTIAVFDSIGLDVMTFVAEWVLPCGAAGAVLVAAWLVEAKQRAIENIAPVLTKVFTPIFALMMLALVVAAVLQWNLVDASRDLLIAFDLVLVVVLGLLVYAYSARDPRTPPGWFDRLQLVLLASALVVDLVVLVAMVARIGEFGVTANKAASLGLNLILLANLVWAGWLHLGFLRGRVAFVRLEQWQTAYLPVYAGWAAVVVIAFPPLFGFA